MKNLIFVTLLLITSHATAAEICTFQASTSHSRSYPSEAWLKCGAKKKEKFILNSESGYTQGYFLDIAEKLTQITNQNNASIINCYVVESQLATDHYCILKK